MSSKKNTTPISLQPLDELFGTTGDGANGICEVSVSSLHSFPNHPFKVKNDKKMEAGVIRFILLDRVGHAYIDRTVTKDEMERALATIFR